MFQGCKREFTTGTQRWRRRMQALLILHDSKINKWRSTHRSNNIVKTKYVPVAQLDRVFGYEPKGQGFESLQARQMYGGLSSAG